MRRGWTGPSQAGGISWGKEGQFKEIRKHKADSGVVNPQQDWD